MNISVNEKLSWIRVDFQAFTILVGA